MLGYLQARLGWDAATVARYRTRLAQSRELRETLRNPFVLYLLAQSWQALCNQPLEGLTRSQVYASFITHLIDKSASLLAPEVRTRLQGNAASLAESYTAFTQGIALLAARRGMSDLPEDLAHRAASPWSRLHELVRQDARQA